MVRTSKFSCFPSHGRWHVNHYTISDFVLMILGFLIICSLLYILGSSDTRFCRRPCSTETTRKFFFVVITINQVRRWYVSEKEHLHLVSGGLYHIAYKRDSPELSRALQYDMQTGGTQGRCLSKSRPEVSTTFDSTAITVLFIFSTNPSYIWTAAILRTLPTTTCSSTLMQLF